MSKTFFECYTVTTSTNIVVILINILSTGISCRDIFQFADDIGYINTSADSEAAATNISSFYHIIEYSKKLFSSHMASMNKGKSQQLTFPKNITAMRNTIIKSLLQKTTNQVFMTYSTNGIIDRGIQNNKNHGSQKSYDSNMRHRGAISRTGYHSGASPA